MFDTHKDEEALFKAALKLTTAAEREAYIEEACGDDVALLARLRSLLKAHSDEHKFLDALMPADSEDVSEGPGSTIGRYKLLERIGEGGMAVVYMAEQIEPIRRKVALKIIKLGMDTRQVIARFEAERQALALMDHPNIAKVLDAGATETGRPYFVMELVQGVSITEYCDRNCLSTKDRLGLFIQVCNAVQHAHTKGIIHRDIKPSNVMVTHHDGKPVPKVIDFGIAKAINQRLTEKTLFTRYAHIIGTPAYMSPEQAELSDLDIDTRTDIYSLGILLYELLTGTTPFSEEELRKAGYVEMQRVIREQQPMKPSTRIRTASVAQPPPAGVTPEGGGATGVHGTPYEQVHGDLDWIVMKTLEKDRSRRYETAGALAEDVRRHLEHEPVLAHGPGAIYHLRKFLRKHRSQVVLVLVLAVFVVAVAEIVSLRNQSQAQRAEAESFKHRDILSQAREQYAKADREAALETIKPILDSQHVGPDAQLLQATILVDNRRLDEAMTILSSLLDERPEVAGAAHSLLARILWESESPDAEKLREIEEHRKQAETLLFGVPPSGGKDLSDPRKRGTPSAEAYFLRAMTAVTIKEQLASLDKALQIDPSHFESRRLRAFTQYASRKYDRLRDDALVMTVLRPRHPLGYSLRAAALRELGQYKEAIVEYGNAIALMSPTDAQYADLSIQRCETMLRMGDYERVIADAQMCLKLQPDKPVFQYHAFCALTALGEYDTATTLFREIIAPGHEARQKFRDWCAKYVFDTLEAGRSWHPPDREPQGAAFLPMVEAEETYRSLSAKAHRLTTDGFSAAWSPDGKKLAFSLGVQGYSGVAIFDPVTKETDLLIIPGKDPRWSPDGKYVAFVRDRQNLRLEELLTPEPGSQRPPETDEELWIMNADGTAPRRLAQGSWPSWASDSVSLYYLSRRGGTLSRVPLADEAGEPKPIMKWSYVLPSVSPDNRHVAHFENGSLKITELASQKIIAECEGPAMSWGVTGWSPTGDEVCLGGGNSERDSTGLWLYNLRRKEFLRVLDGQIAATCWSPAATELTFGLGTPYHEIWSVSLDPSAPTGEALGPAQTLDNHLREMLASYTRRIETDPHDAYAYSSRAYYYGCLGDRALANADMRRWSAAASGRLPWDFRRIIDLPFDCELVFSAERPVNTIPIVFVAFGQKGRCKMKSFEIPMVVTSLLSSCFLAGLDVPPAHADFTFGERVALDPNLNSPQVDFGAGPSGDGLELYFSSNRPEGSGGWDIWMSKRASTADPWGPPYNLGPGINSARDEWVSSVLSDGLTLYLFGWTGTYYDVYMVTRPTRDAPWSPRVSLGPVLNRAGQARASDVTAVISPDDLEMFFGSNRPGTLGGVDIYVTARATRDDPWGPPVNLGPTVNTFGDEWPGPMSLDGLAMFMYAKDRPGGFGSFDVWMIWRPYKDAAWSEPVNLGSSFNTPRGEILTSLSSDGQWAYISKHEATPLDGLWMAPILPIVDFNADGAVDVNDLTRLIENWGTNNTLYDIGPMPWGDGLVDIEDLKIFIAEWEKENQSTQGDGTPFPDFIPTEGSAEGVAVDQAGNVYISVSAASDQVWKFSAAGVGSVLADLGAPGGGALGLATDAAGNIYVCRASVTSAGVLPNHGVYRIAPDGEVSLLPGTEQIVFANALAFDDQETLYITEMFSGDFSSRSFGPGGLWRLTKGGTAQLWVRHELLTGLAPSLFPYPVGANGIAFHRGDLYVVNPDKAMIVRVPVQADGSAGLPEIWKEIEDVPESFLYDSPAFPLMIDGVSVGPDGNLYVTVITRSAIVRIDADDRSQQTVAVYPQVPLDTPANVAFGTDKSGDVSLFITNMGMLKAFIPDQTWPGPGLVKTSIAEPKGSN